MKKIIAPILFAVISYGIMPYLPWYVIGMIALILAAIASPSSMLKSFGLYFAMGFTLWYSMSLLADVKAGSMLSSKIGVLFGKLPRQVLLSISGLIGGITAGLGGMTGSTIHQIFFGDRSLSSSTTASSSSK